MSDALADLRTMPEARVREWFDGLPKEELVEMLVSHVLVYQRDRVTDAGETGGAALGELRSLTFAQALGRLRALTGHAEWGRFRIDGERVVYVQDSGTEVPINATGERAPGPSLSHVSVQARPMGPPPAAPAAPPFEAPPDAEVIDPPRPPPVRPAARPPQAPAGGRRPAAGGGPMFSGGASEERRPAFRPGERKAEGEGPAKGHPGAKKPGLLEF